MKSLVITPKDSKELKFISELLRKMGISSKILSIQEKEDEGLLILMQDADIHETVSRQEIINKLTS